MPRVEYVTVTPLKPPVGDNKPEMHCHLVDEAHYNRSLRRYVNCRRVGCTPLASARDGDSANHDLVARPLVPWPVACPCRRQRHLPGRCLALVL